MDKSTVEIKRRDFLTTTSKGALSAAGLALLMGNSACVAKSIAGSSAEQVEQDIAILNTALGLEHEGITAYQIGAESGLLTRGVKSIAVSFQSHHKEHREVLIQSIRKLGGEPVEEKSMDFYKKSLQVNRLKNQADVIELAAKLELGAVNAYIGVIESLGSKGLATAASKLIADEVMHWTVLTQALKQPLPKKAFSFG